MIQNLFGYGAIVLGALNIIGSFNIAYHKDFNESNQRENTAVLWFILAAILLRQS